MQNISSTKILITGGNGMVGRNLVDLLKKESYTLRYPKSSELDLFDFDSLKKFIEEFKPEIIIHCAGTVGGIHANKKNPLKFLRNYLDMGSNIILASKELGIKKFLNLGSSCMYPRNIQEPINAS